MSQPYLLLLCNIVGTSGTDTLEGFSVMRFPLKHRMQDQLPDPSNRPSTSVSPSNQSNLLNRELATRSVQPAKMRLGIFEALAHKTNPDYSAQAAHSACGRTISADVGSGSSSSGSARYSFPTALAAIVRISSAAVRLTRTSSEVVT